MEIAAELWVDRHGEVLFRYALTRVCNHTVAEDLVQETFLAALRNQEGFSGRSTERTWLVSILRNKIMDHFRRQFRETMISEGIDPVSEWVLDQQEDPGPSPARQLEQRELATVFAKCLSQLSPRSAQAFAMSEIDGVETEEIARLLNISRGNLYVLIHRTKAQLRIGLEAHLLGVD